MPLTSDESSVQSNEVPANQTEENKSAVVWVPDEFHERLRIREFDDVNDVKSFYAQNYHVLSGSFGVLKFMYSVLLTKV